MMRLKFSTTPTLCSSRIELLMASFGGRRLAPFAEWFSCMSLTLWKSGIKWKSFGLFRRGWLIEGSEGDMGKIVRRAWGKSRISDERLDGIRKLAEPPENEIDSSDIPPATEKFWQNAVRSPFY